MHKDAPGFDFIPERFWFAVEGWSDRDIVAYFRLISQQWLRDGLPDDIKEMGGLARGKVSTRVLEKFPVHADGKRRNGFLEIIRGKQRDRIRSRRIGAALTNAKRYGVQALSEDEKTLLRQEGRLAGDSLTLSLSDPRPPRLATPERHAAANGSESPPPPPTTHPADLSPSLLRGRERLVPVKPEGWPSTEAAAIAVGGLAGVPAATAATYWHHCEGLSLFPPGSFASYVKSKQGFQQQDLADKQVIEATRQQRRDTTTSSKATTAHERHQPDPTHPNGF